MEHHLRCNNLKCRRELRDRALVTTCIHVFCTDCASRFQLASQGPERQTTCPACGSHLANPDDAVITQLNPTEDYKTSVLSGLSPNIIVECASRALNFWAYQMTQELVYQEHLSKSLSDRYSSLDGHLDKIISQANTEMEAMQNKLTGAERDKAELRSKYEELAAAFKDKNKRLLQTQELYDKLKRRAMLGQIQDAAESAVETSINAASTSGFALGENTSPSGPNQEPPMPFGSLYRKVPDQHGAGPAYHAQPGRANVGSWNRPGLAQGVPLTPSTHRQRVGDPSGLGLTTIPGFVAGTPQHSRPANPPGFAAT